MIRQTTLKDAESIVSLLEQLGYANTQTFMKERILELLENPNALLFCYESKGSVVALLSLHVIPQLALLGSFLRISYFVVDEQARSLNIGAELEALASQIAQEKGCDRIEVHCHERRKDAHRFYARQGYSESPKYFIKMCQ